MSDFIGFMCKTDFDYEMQGARDGATIYPSEKALRRARSCVAECGIVAVCVILECVVQAENYGHLQDQGGVSADRELLVRAVASLRHALAPFKPAHTKAEAERLIDDIESFLGEHQLIHSGRAEIGGDGV